MIHPARIQPLNRKQASGGRYILYWMQQSQRARWNHALEYAIDQANQRALPVLVCFSIVDDYPGASARHYRFMVEGLVQTSRDLRDRNIRMVLLHGPPTQKVIEAARNATLVVTDRGYTRPGRKWKTQVARMLDCPLIQVESDVVVPVQTASDKEEYSAFTLRKKIHSRIPEFLHSVSQIKVKKSSLSLDIGVPWLSGSVDAIIGRLDIDQSVPPVPDLVGGADQAERLLRRFIRKRLERYDQDRNDPTLDATSGLSPYLHFGQISPLRIAIAVSRATGPGADAFLEELIVRRELAANFALFNARYDSIRCLPDWATKTLNKHVRDRRDYAYTRRKLESARTHDAYWNAAQTEMVVTGRMHGYMRMYWGKKILEWSRTPVQAYRTATYLNDRYQVDGRDPNGHAGVAWCFGKHDRPWGERPIFGTVRYMSANGLKRKFDADAYSKGVQALARRSAYGPISGPQE
jgi:deoxyribodipyrimidine photo-lyase